MNWTVIQICLTVCVTGGLVVYRLCLLSERSKMRKRIDELVNEKLAFIEERFRFSGVVSRLKNKVTELENLIDRKNKTLEKRREKMTGIGEFLKMAARNYSKEITDCGTSLLSETLEAADGVIPDEVARSGGGPDEHGCVMRPLTQDDGDVSWIAEIDSSRSG